MCGYMDQFGIRYPVPADLKSSEARCDLRFGSALESRGCLPESRHSNPSGRLIGSSRRKASVTRCHRRKALEGSSDGRCVSTQRSSSA